MQKRKLGWSDLEVSAVCLGSMTWGQQNTQAEGHQQLDYVTAERRVNFIDTAEIYPIPPTSEIQGDTERIIGNWLQKRGKRDDLVVATKVCVADLISTRETGERPKFDARSINEAIDGSLERLQTDYVDLYQIHWPERNTNFFGRRGYVHDEQEDVTSIEETLTALGDLVKSGKVRYVGVSNETPWGVAEYLRLAREKDLPRLVTIQNQYSLINRQFEAGLAEFSMREQVGLLPYSVLSMGVLTGKYLDGARPVGARFTIEERNMARYNPIEAQPAIFAYVEVAKKHGLDPAFMAISFATMREFTTSTIIGASSVDQLKIAIDAGEHTLAPEVIEDIEAVHRQYPDMQV